MKKISIILCSILLISAGFLSGCTTQNKAPIAVIIVNPTSGVAPLSVVFNGAGSTDSDGSIINYTWDFGDGNLGYGSIVTHVYNSSGNFIVKLFVTDDDKAQDSKTTTISVLPPSVFTRDQAIELLMDSVIGPSSSDTRISAFMLSNVLQPGDIISSEDGTDYQITNNTWFIFIDDDPSSWYSHPTRYVFIDARDGSYNVVNQNWPPLINNYSLWDNTNHSRGDIIDFYPIIGVNQAITDTVSSTAPLGDYGDAPDTQNAYYGIQGRFPTLYNTANSRFGLPGGHTLNVGEETIGLSFSAEVDANDMNDPDLVPNLVDSDKDDRLFLSLNGKKAKLSFTVFVNAIAPDISRYVNVLIDFDQNGNWSRGTYGPEWVTVNYEVDVDPGTSRTIITPEFSWSNKTILPSPVWIRIALTREKINETLFDTNLGWDGSGQYDYGEIEDHILYLMDDPEPEDEWPPWPKNPPGGKDPNPPEPPEPQPPGPSKGPCGTDVNYHCIIINCGDSSDHLSKGANPAAQGAEKVGDLAGNQGYNVVGNLGPGKSGDSKTSMANIQQAIQNLKNQVKCGDHVLIYIIGHGKPASKGGGITIRGSNGITKDTMKPQDLANALGQIPACPDEDCDVEGKCCHVTVVIESCYAGNFNTPGVTGPGRTAIGSADDEKAEASGGGAFTSGFTEASRDEDSDTNDDGEVGPGEAFNGANNSVNDNNNATGRAQEPWIDSQECECKCPCSPDITGDKAVRNGSGEWFDEYDAGLGEILFFRCEIENTGECRNVTTLVIEDTMDPCLEYVVGSGLLYYNGDLFSDRPPCEIEQDEFGTYLTWNLDEIELLAPGETVMVEYEAIANETGDNLNYLYCSAQCTYDPDVYVSATDTVTVNVT